MLSLHFPNLAIRSAAHSAHSTHMVSYILGVSIIAKHRTAEFEPYVRMVLLIPFYLFEAGEIS